MTRPTLIHVPYHLGQRDTGLGKGVPVLAAALDDGRSAVVSLEVEEESSNEIAASLAVVRALAELVRGVRLPVVLAGNCHSSLGTVTGIGGEVGVVWFDAHADFNTPETTRSGFFDGMALSMLTGTGWSALRTGLATVQEEHVVHVGARDVEELERRRFESSGIGIVRRPPLEDALDRLRASVDAVYVHVDLDVLDPSLGRANQYAAEDGLVLDELVRAIDAIGERFEIRAAALTAYDPGCDPGGAIPQAARALYDRLLATAVAG